MVFEDLQWADPGLIDFVESILEWSRNHPIMVVTLARPELIDRRPELGSRPAQLHLAAPGAALRRGDASASRRFRPRASPARSSAKLLERAEGVPLYAVETVRMLVDRGVLRRATTARTASPASSAPSRSQRPSRRSSPRASTRCRTSSDRSLQDAAVLGKSFPTEALAVVHGRRRGTLEPISATSSERSSSLSTPTPARPSEASTASSRA